MALKIDEKMRRRAGKALERELASSTFYPHFPGLIKRRTTAASDATRVDDREAMRKLARQAMDEMMDKNRFRVINPVMPLIRKARKKKTA